MLFIGTQVDEFNQFLLANFIAKQNVASIATSGYFDVLYPYAEKIYVPKKEFWNSNFVSEYISAVNNSNIPDFLEKSGVTTFDKQFKAIFHNTPDSEFIQDFTSIVSDYGGIYKFLFSKIADELLATHPNWILPKEKDYKKYSELLKARAGNKPILCINGRLSQKHEARNESFEWLIEKCLNQGVFIVDVTIGNSKATTNNYWPLKNLTYSEMSSIFLCSNLTVSIGNAGGISTHLLVPANFYILQDTHDFIRGTWVDNPDFGGKGGRSIVESRTLRDDTITIYQKCFYKGLVRYLTRLNIARKVIKMTFSQEPSGYNKNPRFFNEEKIVSI